jgi:uncharacterized protein (TIGR02271 family)
MTATHRGTVVAVFDNHASAQAAIRELKSMGFREDQIGVTSRDISAKGELVHDDDDGGDTYAGEGGMAGLAAGAGVGALWGLGIVSGVLPAIGPAIAGGALAAILSSAAAGAAAAGLAGTLIGLGIPREEAEYYESEFKAGRTIVTVNTEGRYADVLAVLRRHGGYERATSLEGKSFEGKQPMHAQPTHSAMHTAGAGEACPPGSLHSPSSHTSAMSGTHGQQTIQAREEELQVKKERQKAGEVHVRKEVHTEHKTIDVPVEREEVVIERHAASGKAASGPIREGQEIRVPVSEEHVEVTKTPVVKEEVTVGKRKVKDTQHVSDTVRKEEIKVEERGDANVRHKRS